MMQSLLIPATPTTPLVKFDIENLAGGKYIFEITGESRPEDVMQFYSPVIEWLKKFRHDLVSQKEQEDYTRKIKIRLKFQLEFFNSSSAKYIYDILHQMEEINNIRSIAEVKILWLYEENDEDVFQAGEELKQMVRLPFKLSVIRP